jgi:hypothetical protein
LSARSFEQENRASKKNSKIRSRRLEKNRVVADALDSSSEGNLGLLQRLLFDFEIRLLFEISGFKISI